MANTREALQWLLEGHKVRNPTSMSKDEYYVLDETKDSVVNEEGDPSWPFRKGEWEIWKDPSLQYMKREDFERMLAEMMADPKFIQMMKNLADK